MKHTFELPLSIEKNKKGDKWQLNMNLFQRTKNHVLNSYKKKFYEAIKDQLLSAPAFDDCIKITYVVYRDRVDAFDIDNITSVVRKFFQDALTTHGVIQEDNYLFIQSIEDRFGGIDYENPRVEAIIESVDRIYDIDHKNQYLEQVKQDYISELESEGEVLVVNKLIHQIKGETKSTKAHYLDLFGLDTKTGDVQRVDRDHKLITRKN